MPPMYPLLRKYLIMHSNKIREKTKKEEDMGSRKLDPTQEGSVRKPQAESCTAGLKSNHSRLEQENVGFQKGVFGRGIGGVNSRQQVA